MVDSFVPVGLDLWSYLSFYIYRQNKKRWRGRRGFWRGKKKKRERKKAEISEGGSGFFVPLQWHDKNPWEKRCRERGRERGVGAEETEAAARDKQWVDKVNY